MLQTSYPDFQAKQIAPAGFCGIFGCCNGPLGGTLFTETCDAEFAAKASDNGDAPPWPHVLEVNSAVAIGSGGCPFWETYQTIKGEDGRRCIIALGTDFGPYHYEHHADGNCTANFDVNRGHGRPHFTNHPDSFLEEDGHRTTKDAFYGDAWTEHHCLSANGCTKRRRAHILFGHDDIQECHFASHTQYGAGENETGRARQGKPNSTVDNSSVEGKRKFRATATNVGHVPKEGEDFAPPFGDPDLESVNDRAFPTDGKHCISIDKYNCVAVGSSSGLVQVPVTVTNYCDSPGSTGAPLGGPFTMCVEPDHIDHPKDVVQANVDPDSTPALGGDNEGPADCISKTSDESCVRGIKTIDPYRFGHYRRDARCVLVYVTS